MHIHICIGECVYIFIYIYTILHVVHILLTHILYIYIYIYIYIYMYIHIQISHLYVYIYIYMYVYIHKAHPRAPFPLPRTSWQEYTKLLQILLSSSSGVFVLLFVCRVWILGRFGTGASDTHFFVADARYWNVFIGFATFSSLVEALQICTGSEGLSRPTADSCMTLWPSTTHSL